ncbi:MAG TPA: radical SAM protein [Phycisphaerae bacterium]|nr:radical SAM protein [Phycisphaerae bacterium]
MLRERAVAAVAGLAACTACPRHCGVDRTAGELGICQVGRHARVSSAFAHFGEEGCLRGTRGSGTIFFSGCNLRCVFCQNADISQTLDGQVCGPDAIADMMLALQDAGCHNINFVTPEHVVPQVLEALADAVGLGLHIPIVYNTSAYDALESLQMLDGLVDIYMPDFKLWSDDAGERYLHARDYAARARCAIAEMHRQVGPLRLTRDGVACRGVLVRHLVMPGLLAESAAIFRWLADEVSPDTYVNIMAQYRPANLVGRRESDGTDVRFAEVNRRVTAQEMTGAYRLARAAGLWRFD